MPRLFCLGASLILLFGLARIAPAQVRLEGDTCSQAFADSRQEAVTCHTGFRLAPSQRTNLEKASYGLLSDLACSADIHYQRSQVLRQARAGGELQLPPQTVHCRLLAQGQPFHVRFEVAPHVRIAKGRAVDADLGVRRVTGIPEPAASLVAEVLNNDQDLRRNVVQAANGLLANLPRR